MYCSVCGHDLNEKPKDWNSILILAYCFSIFFWSITYLFLKYFLAWVNWSWQTQNTIYLIFGIISSLLTFVLPFGIRTTWMKIVAFIVITIAAIINITSNITSLIEIFNS
jgi:hypothetical protein